MKWTVYNVELTLLTDMLGTTSKNKDVYKRFITSKAPTPEEGEEELKEAINLTDEENAGWTTFLKDEEGYYLRDYMLKGFLKEDARVLKEFGKLKQLRSKVGMYVFVKPEKIRLPQIEDEPLERPLRAETMRGPRVCLARSDVIKAGTKINFELWAAEETGSITESLLCELFDYGQFCGLMQWRGGGYGRFSYVLTPVEEKKSLKKAKSSSVEQPGEVQ